MSRRSRRRRERRSSGSWGKTLAVAGVVFAVVVVAAIGAGVAWVLSVRADAPSISELKPVGRGSVSEILAADQSRIGYIESDAIRDPVRPERMPEALRQATIAIEDENFYDHDGVDWGAVVRAAWENAEAGFEVRQGGSTITQQLVKNLFIPDPEQTSSGRSSRPRWPRSSKSNDRSAGSSTSI